MGYGSDLMCLELFVYFVDVFMVLTIYISCICVSFGMEGICFMVKGFFLRLYNTLCVILVTMQYSRWYSYIPYIIQFIYTCINKDSLLHYDLMFIYCVIYPITEENFSKLIHIQSIISLLITNVRFDLDLQIKVKHYHHISDTCITLLCYILWNHIWGIHWWFKLNIFTSRWRSYTIPLYFSSL